MTACSPQDPDDLGTFPVKIIEQVAKSLQALSAAWSVHRPNFRTGQARGLPRAGVQALPELATSGARFAVRQCFAALFGGGLLDAFGAQLAAGGEDVAAAGGTDGGGVAGAVEDFGEGFDRFPT